MKSGIYLISTPSGKEYVGQSINVRNRISAHKSYMRNGKHPNPRLQAAYDKYGEDLYFRYIISCPPCMNTFFEQKEMDKRKPRLNQSLNAYSPMRDPEIAAKVSRTKKQKYYVDLLVSQSKERWKDPEYRNKMIKAVSGSNKNRTFSKEYRETKSAQFKSLWRDNKDKMMSASIKLSRPVICIETQETFKSISEASRSKGISHSGICRVCNNIPRYRTAGGFHWKFLDEEN